MYYILVIVYRFQNLVNVQRFLHILWYDIKKRVCYSKFMLLEHERYYIMHCYFILIVCIKLNIQLWNRMNDMLWILYFKKILILIQMLENVLKEYLKKSKDYF